MLLTPVSYQMRLSTFVLEEGAGSLGESTGGAVEGASDAVKKLLGSGD